MGGGVALEGVPKIACICASLSLRIASRAVITSVARCVFGGRSGGLHPSKRRRGQPDIYYIRCNKCQSAMVLVAVARGSNGHAIY